MTVDEQIVATQNSVLDTVFRQGAPVTQVDSPPGAGKTYLVTLAAVFAACTARMRVCVVTPVADQGYDLLRRLLPFNVPTMLCLIANDRTAPSDLVSQIRFIHSASPLPAPGILVTTAHKLAGCIDRLRNSFDLLIIDEAYQLATKDFNPIASAAAQFLLVGDPGQLPPVIRSDTTRMEAGAFRMHWATPRELRRRFPNLPRFALPASRRLTQDTVDLIQPSFYSDLPFLSAVDPSQRRIKFGISGMGDAVDRTLDLIAQGASIAVLSLPEVDPTLDVVDADLGKCIARIADRAIERRIHWVGRRELTGSDIGCIDAHVDSGGVIRSELRRLNRREVHANTPEVWQGAERPLTIVRHPLSGCPKPSTFDLNPGRWCVMLSRHQLACIIVTRSSVIQTIGDYQHDCGQAPSGAARRCGGFCGLSRTARAILRAARLRSSCSQTRMTCQPHATSLRLAFTSRALFATSLLFHHFRFALGQVPCMGQQCQKHPSTKTAIFGLINAMSAVTLNDEIILLCILNLRPIL